MYELSRVETPHMDYMDYMDMQRITVGLSEMNSCWPSSFSFQKRKSSDGVGFPGFPSHSISLNHVEEKEPPPALEPEPDHI